MKKFLLFVLLFISVVANAQKGISYQAVILDPSKIEIPGQDISGQPFVNGNVSVKFVILSGTSSQFEEVQQTKTDAYGLVNLTIGSVANTAFNAIAWDANQKSLQVYVSFNNGASYTKVSDQKLSYIPYALYTETAGKLGSTLGIAGGGTGAITAAGARVNLGIGNVDNTADVDKPVSTATQAALDLKVSTADLSALLATKAERSDLNNYASIASPTFTGTITAPRIVKIGGLSTQFLMADGSVSNSTVNNVFATDISVNGLNLGKGKGQIATNTSVGTNVLSSNTTGYFNVGIGDDVLKQNTTGFENTGIGHISLLNNSTGSFNTAIGKESMARNTVGESNTAVGVNTLVSNINGNTNIAIGNNSLFSNQSGSSNTAVGFGSLAINQTGSNLTAIGNNADVTVNGLNNSTAIGYNAKVSSSNTIQLGNSAVTNVRTNGALTTGSVTYPTTHGTNGQVLTTTGSGTLTWTTPISDINNIFTNTGATKPVNLGAFDLTVNGLTAGMGSGSISTNTVLGNEALSKNTSGTSNTAFGASTLGNNSTGIDNTATGALSLLMNTTGSQNTATGSRALRNNTDGTDNTATGALSLLTNTTGSQNTATGSRALRNNTTGNENTASGFYSLRENISGTGNTASGYRALQNNISGGSNTALGSNTLISNTIGEYNTALGSEADVSANNLINATAIGYQAQVSSSNTIQLGNTNVSNVKSSGTLTAGAVTYPNTHGTAGQFLSTTGSGTLTWTSIAADASTLSGTVAIAKGGTGATTAAGARTNLGLVIGTNVQAPLTAGTDYLTPTGSAAGLTNFPTLNQNTTGNASTATKFAASKKINGVDFDGSTDITIVADASTLSGTVAIAKGGTGLTTAGTQGQILTSTGGGTLTWTTSSSVPYSGATSAVDLGSYDLTVNGLTVGMGSGNISSNTALGNEALSNNISGTSNTAIGTDALKINTIGEGNTANGYSALYSNTEGLGNTAIGNNTLYSNTTGDVNTANGNNALYANISGSLNTAIGTASLVNNITGSENTANGYRALDNNLSGEGNTAIGSSSLANNQTGSYNTAIGTQANVTSSNLTNATAIGYQAQVASSNTIQLGNSFVTNVKTSGTLTTDAVTYPNTHGTTGQVLSTTGSGTLTWTSISGNSTTTNLSKTLNDPFDFVNTSYANGPLDVAIAQNLSNGPDVLKLNTSGIANVAFGINNLFSNTTGSANTSVGYKGLYSNTTGQNNSSFGTYSLYNNSTGISNSAFGSSALISNTSGNSNSAFGEWAMFNNLTGSGNTGMGSNALYKNTTGSDNTASGRGALLNNISGAQNTGDGRRALYNNTTGANNTATGYNALYTNTTGSNNTAIGHTADVASNNLTNATALGYGAIVSSDNTVQLGNTSVTNVKTRGTITAGAVTYPNTDGSANQVLSTNGSGTLTWTNSNGFTHYVGEDFGGGIVVSVYKTNGVEHGLIVAKSDASTGVLWSSISNISSGATSRIDGQSNAALIIAQNSGASSAAKICDDLVLNGYSDWYLPSLAEFGLVWILKDVIEIYGSDLITGNNYTYYTSTETSASGVYLYTNSGMSSGPISQSKMNTCRVRAMRKF